MLLQWRLTQLTLLSQEDGTAPEAAMGAEGQLDENSSCAT